MLFILKSLKNGQNRKFLKNSNWIMPKTPGKIHMYDMVKIYTIVFEIGIALTYFLATLPILATKIAITRYLVIVSI